MAILWSRAPQCLLFSHAPFNSPEFRTFADGADTRLPAPEQHIKDGLNRVPEDYQLAVRSILLEDVAKNEEFRTQVLATLKSLPTVSSSSSSQPTPASLNNPRGFVPPSLRQPLPLTTSSHGAHTTSPSGPQVAPFITPLPPWATPAAAPAPVASSPTLPPPSFPFLSPTDTGSSTQSLLGSAANGSRIAPSIPASGAAAPALRDVTSLPFPLILHVPEAPRLVPQVPVELPSVIAPQAVLPVPDDPMDGQWARLTASFSAQKLDKYTRKNRWLRHTGVLIPDYKFPTSGSVRDCWQEWSVGLHGDFSLRELDAYFGSAWRKNDGKKKTPYGKRKVVAEFIEKLVNQCPNWTPELALRFIESQYPKFTARTFHDWTQKPPQHAEVLQHDMTWTP
ncbi:hypothetical protein EXIGLDRAFT_707083 [Exidia glandulosa HHB12029]|uniref:Transcription activator GCR1-like domain-containing protein n=1 Tax=Exidia glandulosa HHB12029 TaxID=1314781 RepID=A0A165JYU9_EXIGL|nr:hypothetical protein EXIGLDRAFT_707083 [Exidia glandulosa HHB12029]